MKKVLIMLAGSAVLMACNTGNQKKTNVYSLRSKECSLLVDELLTLSLANMMPLRTGSIWSAREPPHTWIMLIRSIRFLLGKRACQWYSYMATDKLERAGKQHQTDVRDGRTSF